MRRFELVEGKSSKFWEIAREEKRLVVRFGRIGTKGQTQEKTLDTEATARTEHDRLVAEKKKKGYAEIPCAEAEKSAPAREDAAEAVAVDRPAPKVEQARGKKKEAMAGEERGWIDAGNGYRLALEDGKVRCRNPKGQVLSSVPKDLREGHAFEQLDNVREFLLAHDRECVETVEGWMIRSLPAPRAVLGAVWGDPSWRRALQNAIVVPLGQRDTGGFFRGVDDERGIGIVDRDGETVWLLHDTVEIPHPIHIPGLDDLRALATELSLVQGIPQLFREVFTRKAGVDGASTQVRDYANGTFKQLNHALSLCKKNGFRVSGGSAVTRVWELDDKGTLRVQEARYWIGSDDPMSEAWTGDLVWVDEREKQIPLSRVGPAAFSEGMRMASTIYGGRVVETEKADA